MTWLGELFAEHSFVQAILVISIICAVGLVFSKFKLKRVSLGVTFVFFAGIMAGHFGLGVDPQMLALAQNFGLILFVYVLGLQVGPSFFPSLKKGGIKLNILSFAVLAVGCLIAVGLGVFTKMSVPVSVGLLTGASTNTPMLGAAQQTLLETVPGSSGDANLMATACAVGYPFGVVGVIAGVAILKFCFRKKSDSWHEVHENPTYVSECRISNPAVFGKSIRQIMKDVHIKLVVSRVWKDDGRVVIIPNGDTVLEEGEHVLVMSDESELGVVEQLFGQIVPKDWNKKGIDWNNIDGTLVSRHVLVTKSDLNGAKLGDLHLRNLYAINITRVNRASIDILPSSSLRLQLGDKLTIVGHTKDIDNVAKVLGNQEKELRNPNLFSIFVGLFLGLVLGSLPIAIPGMSVPVKLGVAGGPIIVGILMGAFGSRLHMSVYTTRSANMMLRQLGITVYLACLGLSAGPQFFTTVLRPEGLIWVLVSIIMAVVPVLVVGLVAGKFCKVDFAANAGMLCGAMANPIALDFALSAAGSDEPSVSYATVYPVGMFLHVIFAQILIVLLV